MKQLLKLVLVLTLICVGAGLLLAVVNGATYEKIEQVAAEKRLDAIAEVLPDVGSPAKEVTVVDPDTASSNTFYVAKSGEKVMGAALEASSPNGYGGDIRLMLGINAERKIQAIYILEQKETPGLGAKVDTDEFKAGYAGRSLDGTTWKVKKDGGDLDAITAATISSRAVAEAVGEAVQKFEKAAGDLGL